MTEDPITDEVSPLCQVCAHLQSGAEISACAAFPGGIPDMILAGEPHVDPCPGDRGIAFRKRSGEPSFFIAGTRPETLFRVTCAGSYERYVPILDLWELDDVFIRYVRAIPLQYRPIDAEEADAFMEHAQKCLDSMNPCTREVRQKMYLSSRKNGFP